MGGDRRGRVRRRRRMGGMGLCVLVVTLEGSFAGYRSVGPRIMNELDDVE